MAAPKSNSKLNKRITFELIRSSDESLHTSEVSVESASRWEESSDEEDNPYRMTENVLEERTKKADRGNIYPQICACLVVTFGPISTGYTIGYIGTQVFKIYTDATIPQHYHAQYASVLVFGFALGNVVFTMVCLRKGPRRVLLIAAPSNLVPVLAIAVQANHDYYVHYMFVWTFLTSSYTSCGLVLLSDLIHEANFHICKIIFYAGNGFGIMLAVIVGYDRYLGHFSEGMQALILMLYFLLLLHSDESPVILYDTNRRRCESVLETYRGNSDTPIIMRMIAKDCDIRKLNVHTRYMFTFKAVYKAFAILVATALLEVVYLYDIFLFYNMSVWAVTTRSRRQFMFGRYWDGFVLGSFYFLAPLMSQMLQLRRAYGIRKPMMVSAIGVPIVHATLAMYFYLLETGHAVAMENKWPLLWIKVLLIVCYNIGHSGTIEYLIGEYLPEQMKIWASLGIISLRYTFISIMLWFTYMLQAVAYAYAIISMFLLASLLGIPFCYFCIVEPKGKTLQQVQLEIGGNPIGSHSVYRRKLSRYCEMRLHQRV